ncbi:MAG: 2-dehydropantoate 2-reductase [Leptolyngbya sp. SIO4C1]|nr:2-dehydropantoate 2-reductase [Leptolyngbya sp. SIO4C1]
MLKILIFGAGSVGTYFGTKLYAAQHDVQLYGRGKLQQLGSTVYINGQRYQLPPKVDQLDEGPYQLILVTTKLLDVAQAVTAIEQHRPSPQIVAFVQNGIVEDSLYGSLIKHPGFITISLFNGYHLQQQRLTVLETHLGVQVENSSVGKKLCELFNSAGIFCQATAHIEQMRARKLILNAALNALSGLLQKSMGALVDDPQIRPTLEGLIYEGWAVLRRDYNLPPPDILAEEIYQAARQAAHHYSSLYQDLQSGRPTEIEFLNGLIVKRGQQQGIATPYNQQIHQQVLLASGGAP